jgi:hypothetical protein
MRMVRMAEVQRGKVGEIDNEEEFGKPESGPNPEHQEAKVQQVVEDEMAPNVACGRDKVGV